MIDAENESLLSLTEAAKNLPGRRQGKRPHVSCIYRWTVSGCRGVVLESIQIGGTRCTSREALARFFAKLTGEPIPPAAASRTTAQRQRAIAQANAELDAAGI